MSLAAGEARTPSGFERLPGVTPPTSREPSPGFLTDTILELGLADAAHVDAAIQESRVRGVAPESLLLMLDQIDQAGLARARAERAGLDYVDVATFDRDHEADVLIGRAAAERYRALPIALEGRSVVVAISDPIDAPAIAELPGLAKYEVVPVIAAGDAIEALLKELPEHIDEPAEVEQPVAEPIPLQAIDGGGSRARAAALPQALADRIVERVDEAIDDVTRSELLKALDEATAEVESLSTKLALAEERAKALEAERDELRAELGA